MIIPYICAAKRICRIVHIFTCKKGFCPLKAANELLRDKITELTNALLTKVNRYFETLFNMV